MIPKISEDQRDALEDSAGKPVECVDDQTKQIYVLMSRQDFQRFVYDDSELTPAEMLAAAAHAMNDADGWGAPELDVYDQDDSSPADS